MKPRRSKSPRPSRAPAWQRPLVLAPALFGFALLVRIVNLDIIDTNPYYDAPVMDEAYHHVWAAKIADGAGGEYLPFYRAPGYPYLLAAVYAVHGAHVPAGRLLSSVLGAATVALTFLLGLRVAGRGAAVIAAAALALYPLALYFDGMLLGAALETLLGVAALLALLAALDAKGPALRWPLVLGAVLGLATITRPLMAVLLPIAAVFLHRSHARSWRAAVLTILVWALPVLAVTVANMAGGGDRVLVAWNGGINFFLGNNPDANGWSATAPELRPSWWSGYLDAVQVASRELGHQASPSEVSAYWFRRGLGFIVGQPAAWLALMARKLYLLLNAVEISNNQDIRAFMRYSPLLRVPLGFAVLIALGVPQLLARPAWRRPLPWFLVVYGLAVVLFFVTGRYRMPLVPLLLVLAARTVTEGAGLLRAGHWRPLGRIGAVAVLAAGFSGPDWANVYRPDPASNHFSLGNRYFQAGAFDQAIAEYEQALRLPGAVVGDVQIQALNNIAAAHLRQERSREARRVLEQSIRVRPTTEAYARLGWSHFQEGRLDSARAALDRALAIHAANPEALYYLGHVARVEGELDEAIATWERAAAQHPDPSVQQTLYYALVTAYMQSRRDPARALYYLDRITQPFPDLDRMRAACEAALRR